MQTPADLLTPGVESHGSVRESVNEIQLQAERGILDELASIIDEYEAVLRRKAQIESEEQTILARGEQIIYRLTKVGATRNSDISSRTVLAEFATAARVTPNTIAIRMGHAGKLVNEYPAVHDALATGALSYAHSRVIVEEGLHITSPERRQTYEDSVMDVAREESVNRLRPLARRFAEAAHERTIEERHEEAKNLRSVRINSAEDGMVDLTAHLPAVEGYAVWDKLTRGAIHVKNAEAMTAKEARVAREEDQPEGETLQRTIDQVRVDILYDSILNNHRVLDETGPEDSADAGKIQSKVQVLIPANVLTDMGNLSPETRADFERTLGPLNDTHLAGYGAIDRVAGRRVAAEATAWERLFVDSDTGNLLGVDRYRPSEDMRRLLGARDQHCRFPGCRMPAVRCDLDHTVDFAHGGKTEVSNMATLCRGHHTLKHNGGWKVKQSEGGVLEWRSPAGKTYRDKPVSRVLFRPTTPEEPKESFLSEVPKKSDLSEVSKKSFLPDVPKNSLMPDLSRKSYPPGSPAPF